MDKNNFLLLASIIFGVVALLHLARAALGWKVVIGIFNIPVYFSYIGLIAAAFLSWTMYRASRK